MEFNIGIKKQYLDTPVECFENMFPFIEPDKTENGEIKIDMCNTLYKKNRRFNKH